MYTHIEGGQLDALGFAGISIGMHVHVFGKGAHAHDDGPTVAPGDWTGLDEADASPDGRAVPLVPVLGKITVFDFWATWCKPCGVVDHELAAIARRHPDDLAVRKIDVSDSDSPAARTHPGSATLPYLEVFGRDGKRLWARSASPLALTGDVEKAITGPRPKRPIDPSAPRVQIDVKR